MTLEPKEKTVWNPRTKLGMLVQSGKITHLNSVFEMGYRIREPEIVKTLLPDIKSEVISAGIVQKQTDAGEVTRFVAIVAVGTTGWFGVGRGKAMQMRSAIDKATNAALLNVLPVKLGCGSWECRCSKPHSVPYKVVGKAGSVTVEIIPGPRGLGLVAGETVRKLLALAGIVDAWTRTFGSTSTPSSITNAVNNAFRNMHKLNIVGR